MSGQLFEEQAGAILLATNRVALRYSPAIDPAAGRSMLAVLICDLPCR